MGFKKNKEPQARRKPDMSCNADDVHELLVQLRERDRGKVPVRLDANTIVLTRPRCPTTLSKK
ncbi:hypothetical protein D0T87_15765 [Bacteroides sp. 51]|nr:hypothetical protein [Bacteroides sp. 51]